MAKLSSLVPQARWAKLAIGTVVGVAIIALLWVVAYRLFFQGQDLARERGNAVVTAEQTQAEDAIVRNTLETVRERDVYREHVRTTVMQGKKEIDDAWHGETVGEGVDRAGADALCKLHDSLCRPAPTEDLQQVR